VVVTMGAPPISLMGDDLIRALTERVGTPSYAPRHSS
jgi:hypothetical protein